MADKPVVQPGPDHPIAVLANPNRVVVSVGGCAIANSVRTPTLQEADHPAVHYIPMADVDTTHLEHSKSESYCPYKGDASYFNIPAAGDRGVDAVWVYESHTRR